MRVFISPTIDALARRVLGEGAEVSPRGLPTRELLGVVARWPMGEVPLRVGMSRRLAVTEAWMLIAGTFDLELVRRAAPNARSHLFTRKGQYGPLLRSQVGPLVSLLKSQPDSRQSVLYFGRPKTGPDDRPCTTSIQFLVRNGHLEEFVTMRSWDLVYGVPNDVTMFAALGLAVAKVLGVLPGQTTVTAASLHAYSSTAHLAASSDPPRGRIQIAFQRDAYPRWKDLVAEALSYRDEPWRWITLEPYDEDDWE